MYDESSLYTAIWLAAAFFTMFFYIFIIVGWLATGAINHTILQKKGYKHTGLYVLAWLPIINQIIVFCYVALPDVRLHNKLQYFCHLLSNGGHGNTPSQPSSGNSGINTEAGHASSTNYNPPNHTSSGFQAS